MRDAMISSGVELIAVGEASMLKAQKRVVGCQNCSTSVSHPFSSLLIQVLGVRTTSTEYLLCLPASCPNCSQPIVENTLVRCEGDADRYNADLDFGRCWEGQ
jgi:hypothetical protein